MTRTIIIDFNDSIPISEDEARVEGLCRSSFVPFRFDECWRTCWEVSDGEAPNVLAAKDRIAEIEKVRIPKSHISIYEIYCHPDRGIYPLKL